MYQLTRVPIIFFFQGGLGGAQAFAKSETLVNLLKKQRESNRPYGAICASPALVLEPHGLLKVCPMQCFQKSFSLKDYSTGNLVNSINSAQL